MSKSTFDWTNINFPVQCMHDFGTSCSVWSPDAAKPFKIPGIQSTKEVKCADVIGREIVTEGVYTILFGVSFVNLRPDEKKDHVLELMKTVVVILMHSFQPGVYEKHMASGVTTFHYHFQRYAQNCYRRVLIHPEHCL